MAVWSQKWYITIPLVAIILGHWSLLLHGKLLHFLSLGSIPTRHSVSRHTSQSRVGPRSRLHNY